MAERADRFENEFRYECTKHHLLESAKPIDVCLGRWNGRPCPGRLVAYGPGANKENERLEGTRRGAHAR